MRSINLAVFLFTFLLIACACVPVQAPAADDGPALDGTEAAIYAERGPHAVGYTPLIIDEGDDRPIDLRLWYPALNPTGAEESVTYEVSIGMPEMQGDGPAVVYGEALLDAPVDEDAGPYPLVVFSHGFGLNAPTYHTILEHLASYGFVVLAPEHVEGDWFDGVKHTLDRPADIKRTLDFAEELNSPNSALSGLIDIDHVGVVGHSYGGYTALAVAGAQMDFEAFNERCDALPQDAPEMFLCMPLLGKAADLASGMALDGVPEGLWPSQGDPRVSAIVPMAGDAFLFDEAGLASVTVPMLVLGGTADTGTPYQWGSRLTYDSASSEQKSLVGLEGAEHMIVASPCEDLPWLQGNPLAEYLCVDPAWDKEQALDLVRHYSTAFLLDTLRNDASARAALMPGATDFRGIVYETTLN